MHNGSEKTIDDVIDLYKEGGREKRASLSQSMPGGADLTKEEVFSLKEFLKTLSSQDEPVMVPLLPQ